MKKACNKVEISIVTGNMFKRVDILAGFGGAGNWHGERIQQAVRLLSRSTSSLPGGCLF